MKEVSDAEGAVAEMTPSASRRQLLTGGVAAGLAAAGAAVSVPTAAYSATAFRSWHPNGRNWILQRF